MKVYGYEPTEDQLNAAIEYMKFSTTFRARNIEWVLTDAGVPEVMSMKGWPVYVAHRTSDRLIQKLRKQNKIELIAHQTWQWKED